MTEERHVSSAGPTHEAMSVLPPDNAGGTVPGDRRFRPDVEGLRAVAILLVILFHARVPHISGGYVGVDVFFVISGFVITGVLLRERASDGRTSLMAFYARRCRRILPAASLVIVVTVVSAYLLDGRPFGSLAANDGRWAAVFLANFHFASLAGPGAGTRPLSPLGNFWSLSIEEQFYLVYPTLFLTAWVWGSRRRPGTSLAFALGLLAAGSFLLCVLQTHQLAGTAYFSPFARAWELSIGALVALATVHLQRLGPRVAAAMTWAGMAAIVASALVFTATTVYPGALAAIPVLGAALVIAGGCANPATGCEKVLGLVPFLWLGRRSYSWYLWHWPVLIVYAEQPIHPYISLGFSLGTRILLMALALGLAAATFALVEDPVRRVRIPARSAIVGGVASIVVIVAGCSVAIATG